MRNPTTILGSRSLPASATQLLVVVWLVVVGCYLLLVPLGYQHGWVNPESFNLKASALSDGRTLSPTSLARMFDFGIYEMGQPRSTRPLSALGDIVDAKLRSALWRIVPPHPTLSLTALVMITLVPWLLFLFLRHIGVGVVGSLVAVAFYLVSPGCLSLVAMQFRSGKAWMTLFFVLALNIACRIQERDAQSMSPLPAVDRSFWALMACTVVAFFCDETGLLLFPALWYFFPRLFRGRRRAIFLLLPAVAVIGYFLIFPAMALLLGYGHPKLGRYAPVSEVWKIFKLEFFKQLAENLRLVVRENFALFNPLAPPTWWGKALCVGSWVAFLFLGVSAARAVVSRRESSVLLEGSSGTAASRFTLGRVALFLVFLGIFHAMLMHSVNNQVWGPYWYGHYTSLFAAILVGVLGREVSERAGFVASTIAIGACLMFSFTYLNLAYRQFHLYPYDPPKIASVFTGQLNRFVLTRVPPVDMRPLTVRYWADRRERGGVGFSLPKELFYLPVELGTKDFYPFAPVVLEDRSDYFPAP